MDQCYRQNHILDHLLNRLAYPRESPQQPARKWGSRAMSLVTSYHRPDSAREALAAYGNVVLGQNVAI